VNVFAAQESTIIADIQAMQLSMYTYAGDKVQKINEHRNSVLGNRTRGMSEEDILACENILLIEECNFSPSDSNTKKALYLSLRAQNDKCELYMREHKNNGVYFLTSLGDIKVRLLEFIPQAV
jgi:hypothetical protein